MEMIAMVSGFMLIIIGLSGALSCTNILRMIVAFSVANTGVHLVLVGVGSMRGRTAPILDSPLLVQQAAERIIDPLPQALVLTAIVIGLGITALMLAYAYRLYKSKGSLDIGKFTELKW